MSVLKVLYKKLQIFVKENRNKEVSSATYSAADIANILLLRFLLNVTPNDPELKSIREELEKTEDVIKKTIADVLGQPTSHGGYGVDDPNRDSV